MRRREFICATTGLALGAAIDPAAAFAQTVAQSTPSIRPTWLSFGINGPALGSTRYPLTMAIIKDTSNRRPNFELQVSGSMEEQLKSQGDFVEFRDSADFNAGVLLGAILDYENVLSARLGTAEFVVLHLVGHGVLMNFDRTRGWKMLSSFPFPVTLLRESHSADVRSEASRYLLDAYTAQENSFSSSFARTARRLSPRWKETGSGFNARFVSSEIHTEVARSLAEWGIAKNISEIWLGHLASAAACEGLGIPLVPYAENQALGKFTYKFSERLVAQDVRLPDVSDIDLRLHVVLRNILRSVKYRAQYQRWEVTRAVVMDLKATDDQNKEIVSFRMGYQDEQPDTLAKKEDLVPARDAHFFDMAIYRGLTTLFSGIDRRDLNLLNKVFVKPDAELQRRMDAFRGKYQRSL